MAVYRWSRKVMCSMVNQLVHVITVSIMIWPNKLTFLVLVSIPLKKWRCGANFYFLFFLSAVKSRGIPMLTNMYLMVYEQYKFHLSIVCDM